MTMAKAAATQGVNDWTWHRVGPARDGEEAAENVQRDWRKCVLASKYLQLKRELAVSQHKAEPAVPSKGRANDRAKLLRQLMLDWRQYYGDCDATDAETEASMRETSEQWPDVTEIDLVISGQQRDITPAMGMQTTCFTEHREGKLPTRLTGLSAENQGLSAENQGLKVLFWSASALVMALAVCLYFKTVAEVPI
eukprot:s3443_g10.t1